MKAYVITLQDVKSYTAANSLIISSGIVRNKFKIKKFPAIIPKHIDSTMFYLGIEWNYPWDSVETDEESGLIKTPYTTADPKKRIACFLSHYSLWRHCVRKEEPVLILEQDALFIRKLPEDILEHRASIIGLNDPRGATRRAELFYAQVVTANEGVVPVPIVDDWNVPQGLAGNSAYIIKPVAAEKLIKLVKKHGAWPNDAIMCQQLLPDIMGVTNPFYTKVQRLRSTTTK